MDKERERLSLGNVPGISLEMYALVEKGGCDLHFEGMAWNFDADDLLAFIDRLTTVWLRMDEIERERR